jgi:hypothetical protein
VSSFLETNRPRPDGHSHLVVEIERGCFVADVDEPFRVGMGIGQEGEEYALQRAEDGNGQADPDGEGQNRENREASVGIETFENGPENRGGERADTARRTGNGSKTSRTSSWWSCRIILPEVTPPPTRR